MKHIERKELLSNVQGLMIHYCDGCFLHQHIKKEGGRRLAHRFCITQCTVGETLKEYGKQLT